VGEKEARAWTIRKGTLAPQAAGEIHSDLEKQFIRAEVIAYDDFVSCKTRTIAKEKGLARTEGKTYVVKDGDVILFFHG
jgi:ribosome-binding ATPase YchF (GTP1/OBG family)